jgi:polysaccharide deacetylase family protein (PEP-CTERM system associated)
MRRAGCALTVDVEEWFHICGVGGTLASEHWQSLPSRVVANTEVLLDMLDRRGVRATFFVLGYVARCHPELVQAIRRAGHEVGSHGHMHTRVYEMTRDGFSADLDRSLSALADAGADHVTAFRAPEWSINDRSLWALDVLATRGIHVDSSMAPLRMVGNPRYEQVIHRRATPHGEVVECPPMVSKRMGQNVPGGGGWGLRMRSPRATLRELERRSKAGQSSILWVHPWELDDDPPRVPLPRAKWFAHYFRLDGFRTRLDAILRDGAFVPLDALVSEAGLG